MPTGVSPADTRFWENAVAWSGVGVGVGKGSIEIQDLNLWLRRVNEMRRKCGLPALVLLALSGCESLVNGALGADLYGPAYAIWCSL